MGNFKIRREKNKEMAQARRRILQKYEKKIIVIRGRGKWKCQFDGLRPWEGKLYGPLVWSIEAVVALPQPFALTAASNHLSPADWDSSPLPSLDLIVRLFFKLDFYYQMYQKGILIIILLDNSFIALLCLSLCDVVVKPYKLKFA